MPKTQILLNIWLITPNTFEPYVNYYISNTKNNTMKKVLLLLLIAPILVIAQEVQVYKLDAVDVGFGLQGSKGTVTITENAVVIDYKKKSFPDTTYDLTIYEKVRDGEVNGSVVREYRSSNGLERILITTSSKTLNAGTLVQEIKDDFNGKIYKFTYLFKN